MMNYPNSTVIDVNVLMVLMSVINYKQALHEFIESILLSLMMFLSTPVSNEAIARSQYNNETETLNATLSHNECLNILQF